VIDECEDAEQECFRVASKLSEMVFLVPHRRCFDYHGLHLEEPGSA
jgi:hypothetical protein